MKVPEGQTPPEVANLISDIIRDKVVCDVGCGGGSFMQALATHAARVFGVEEDEQAAQVAHSKGFDVFNMNTFHQKLPPADVYYLWTKDAQGVFLKARFEEVKGTFVFGHSERPSMTNFFTDMKMEKREVDGFKIFIINI